MGEVNVGGGVEGGKRARKGRDLAHVMGDGVGGELERLVRLDGAAPKGSAQRGVQVELKELRSEQGLYKSCKLRI